MNTLILIASDGKTFSVNRYFLQLYNSFYWCLLEDQDDPNIVIIYEGLSSEDLAVFVQDVMQRHLYCKQDYSTSSVVTKESEALEAINRVPIQYPVSVQTFEDKQSKAETVRCPFHCPQDEHWNNDMALAHLYTNHYEELSGGQYSWSLKRLLEALKTKLTSMTCALKNCTRKKPFNCVASLVYHYKEIHCENENAHVCDHCGQTFRSLESQKEHLRRAKRRNIYVESECKYCGKKFTNDHVRKEHVRAAHEGKKVACDQCDRKCLDTKQLRDHINSVHKHLKPFVCDICGTKMARLENLSDHRVKVHRQERFSMSSYKKLIKEGNHPFLKEYLDHKNVV